MREVSGIHHYISAVLLIFFFYFKKHRGVKENRDVLKEARFNMIDGAAQKKSCDKHVIVYVPGVHPTAP